MIKLKGTNPLNTKMVYGELMECKRTDSTTMHMNIVSPRIMRVLIICALVLVPLFSCSHIYGLATHGKVVEYGTNKPITDAFVVVRWEGVRSIIVDSQSFCAHVEIALSNGDGYFRTPAWRVHSFLEPAAHIQMSMSRSAPYAYKSGYEWVETKNGVIYLKLSNQDSKSRLEWLAGEYSSNSCRQAGRGQRNLFPLYKAFFDEAKNLATDSNEDQQLLYQMRLITAEMLFTEDYYLDVNTMHRLATDYIRDHMQ